MPPLDWTGNGTPVSRRYGDPYWSLQGGLAEKRHVFLAGNDLPGRFRPGFVIAELGFGTGLNALAAWQAWLKAGIPGPLSFTSFESEPVDAEDMDRALAAFPDLAPWAGALVAGWRGSSRPHPHRPAQPCRVVRLSGPDGRDLDLTLVEGDAALTLPGWGGLADAWFLDGFSPARNPGLWTAALMADVARHTAPGGSLATYSAARSVRDALAAAGFVTERRPGFGSKRHMTRACLGPAA